MKKILLALVLLLALPADIYALEIKFTVDDADVPRIIEAMGALYPIPDDNGDGTPDFTPAQWAKEAIRRFVISSVARYETAKARNAIIIPAEDDLVK